MKPLTCMGLLLLVFGCSEVKNFEVTPDVPVLENRLVADYERQEPSAIGPDGARLVSGLYANYSSWYGWGCGVGYGEPTLGYDEDEIELYVLGSCSASYRRAGAVWYTDVDGYFRLVDLGPQMPATTDATVEVGVRHDGYANIEISSVKGDGTETKLCDMTLDSRGQRERACNMTLGKGGWYRLRVWHTERLPELYVGGTINGGVRIQWSLPWGLGLQHYTDFDKGGQVQERLLNERGCPEVVSAPRPRTNPTGGLVEGLAVEYYAYDDYACAVFDDALTPVCQNDKPNIRFRTGATGSWSLGDLLTMRYQTPSANPTACETATSTYKDWAARMSGYMKLERLDSSAPAQVEISLDGDVNDGFRMTIYDWQTGQEFCVVDTMWTDAPGSWNYQSIDAVYSNIMGPNHCARRHTFDTGVYYPVTIDYYHHKTGGSRDESEMDLWWRGLVGKGLASGLYRESR